MIRFTHNQRSATGRMVRRDWLRVSGLGAMGLLGLDGQRSTLAAPARRARGFGQAKSVIFIYASGGQSQIDTWDPKPKAPADVRGEFQPISTATPGVAFCEHLPRVAKLADKFTLVRSMSHDDLDHGSATYLTLTGRYHQRLSSNPPASPSDMPAMGAVLKRVRPTDRFAYDAIHLNGPALVPILPAPGQNGGLLGREYEPLVLGDVSREQIALPGLTMRDGLPPNRLSDRLGLKQTLDSHARLLDTQSKSRDMTRLYGQAIDLLRSPRFRDAFDLSREPKVLRERYGLHRSGQACLLARRLAEAGAPLTTVMFNHSNRGQDLMPDATDAYGWDTHNDIFDALRHRLLPRFDATFAALLTDLDERGMLDETLVICAGEFGRAPRVALEERFAGSSPGRKHWSSVYSIVVAGAGVARGGLVGVSDRMGGEPLTDRYAPWDLTATIFSALGIDPTGHYYDVLHRPWPISVGRVMEDIYT